MISTEADTSQVGGSDSDSSVFSSSFTTPTISYSGDSKWVLDIGATYHVCPNKNFFSSFEKLDGCFSIIGDDHSCKVEGICTIYVKMFDGIVWELKEVRYIPQLKMNLISIGALKAFDLEESIRDVFSR